MTSPSVVGRIQEKYNSSQIIERRNCIRDDVQVGERSEAISRDESDNGDSVGKP